MKQVTDLADITHWAWWHDDATNAPRRCPHCGEPLSIRRNRRGFPDLVLVRPPVLAFLELKTGGRTLTPEQLDWIAHLEQCRRIEVLTAWPEDWDRITALLTRDH